MRKRKEKVLIPLNMYRDLNYFCFNYLLKSQTQSLFLLEGSDFQEKVNDVLYLHVVYITFVGIEINTLLFKGNISSFIYF